MSEAYVTTVCGGDAYIPGVEVLGRSLFETGTKIPRVALVTHDVSTAACRRLAAQGWEISLTEEIANPRPECRGTFPRFAKTFTKLRAFGLDQFEKIVLLDGDTVVLRNIDNLFERPSIAAAPDFFLPDRFNSGVMVIEPSTEFFARVEAALIDKGSYDGGDQGFLNEFFPTWYEGPGAHRLRAADNLHHFVFQFLLSREGLRERILSEVRVVHFTLQKPWMGATFSGGSQLWWDFFFGVHPKLDSPFRRRLHRLEDWSFESAVRALGG